LHHIQPDHLGTPRKVIQTSNNTAIWNWPILGNAFGEAAPTGTITLNLRFPGQYFDAETGLNYNYFRDYEPGTGRYVESDPIGLEGGISTYGYVMGSPLGMTDRDGLSPRVCCRLLANPFFGRLLRLRHCYISDGDDVFSLAPNGPDGVFTGVTQKHYFDDETDAAAPDKSTKCKDCKAKNCATDPSSCIKEAFNSYPNPSSYYVVGKNSNTMVGNVFSSCCEGALGAGDGLGNTPGISQSPARAKK